jgi:hypothetical protein
MEAAERAWVARSLALARRDHAEQHGAHAGAERERDEGAGGEGNEDAHAGVPGGAGEARSHGWSERRAHGNCLPERNRER